VYIIIIIIHVLRRRSEVDGV